MVGVTVTRTQTEVELFPSMATQTCVADKLIKLLRLWKDLVWIGLEMSAGKQPGMLPSDWCELVFLAESRRFIPKRMSNSHMFRLNP